MADIGVRIKELREALNLSQDDLAQKVGYKSRSSINKIELGKTDISQSKIQDFANALKTTPAYLMGWEPGENIIAHYDISNAGKHFENQKELLNYFDKLNSIGEKEAIKRIEELTHLSKYTDNQQPLLKEITKN